MNNQNTNGEICQYCQKFIKYTKKYKNLIRHYAYCKPHQELINTYITNDYLNNLYIKNEKSILEIIEQVKLDFNLNISYSKIKNKLIKFKIPLRNITEACKTIARSNRIKNTCLKKYGDINVLGKKSPLYAKRNETVLKKYRSKKCFSIKYYKRKN